MRLFLTLASCAAAVLCNAQNLARYIDPMIGTGGHGHTYPGATMPFGMVQLSPDTRNDGSWDGCSGYHYSDSVIYGFSHTHLSGTGCSDFGDILLMPFQEGLPESGFSHARESAKAGYYAVHLTDDDISAELTATTRTGYHHYTFHRGSAPKVFLDLNHRDELLQYEFRKISDRKFAGMRRSKAWATDQRTWFFIEFSAPVTGLSTSCNNAITNDTENIPQDCRLASFIFSFDSIQAKDLFVKVSLSPVSIEGAMKNMDDETGGKTFETVRKEAEETWNEQMRKIEVSGGSEAEFVNFYTALYHTMIVPNTATDTDGQYRGRDGNVHRAEGFTYYSVFSLWDTFRAAHPLYTLIEQQRAKDFVKTFLAQYSQGGRLPVWELACNETDCMIGYHSVSVIADAAIKGLLTDEEIKLGYEAGLKSASWNHLGLPAMMDHQYIAVEDDHESVSKTLEYAYDDWCIQQLLKLAGKPAPGNFDERSFAYRNLYDPVTGFFRPRKNGGWLEPFDPREVNNHYTEANAWQYLFFVPHDIGGLIKMMGGKRRFAAKLDSLFTVTSVTTGREQVDITGLIGQYAHGNEPSHGFAYLYNYAGEPWKSQQYLRLIMDSLYHPEADGLPGNEDCGQMSAWYVFSALGFYPVTPGKDFYTWGTPLFERARIRLENKKEIIIHADGVSSANKYIETVEWNGVQITAPGIRHSGLVQGGTLAFSMNAGPGNAWTMDDIADPHNEGYVPAPVILSGKTAFRERQEVTIKSLDPNAKIIYSVVDEGVDIPRFADYKGAFQISASCKIMAYAVSGHGNRSSFATAYFKKIPNNWALKLFSRYNRQYTAGGDEGLIDGLRGDVNWRKGGWQGYQSQDVELVIDLGEIREVTSAGAGFLQDSRAWILMPLELQVYTSEDGVHYREAARIEDKVDPMDDRVSVQDIEHGFTPVNARYVKFVARNFGKLPEGHQGFGGDAFIFIDEVWVR